MQDLAPPHTAKLPRICPVCRSSDLKATGKVIGESTYWRCEACGEIWNAGRRKGSPRG